MEYADILHRIETRTGLTEAQSKIALEATLQVLGRSLFDGDARALADQLPKPIARILDSLEYVQTVDEDEFFRRIAQRAGLPLGFAKEQATVVCETLAEAVDREDRGRFPAELSRLFAPWAPPSASLVANDHVTHGHTLATGRVPGGQSDSIAENDNPKGHRKLSSAGEPGGSSHSLAGGRPGSKRSIGGG